MGIKVSSLLFDTKLRRRACDGNVSLSEGVLAATAKLLLRDTVPFSFPSAMALHSPARNGLLDFHYSEASCSQHILISLTLKARVLFHVLDLFKCLFSFCVCCQFRCFANFPAVSFCFRRIPRSLHINIFTTYHVIRVTGSFPSFSFLFGGVFPQWESDGVFLNTVSFYQCFISWLLHGKSVGKVWQIHSSEEIFPISFWYSIFFLMSTYTK